MKWFTPLMIGMLTLSLITGCLETTQVISLNLNGSGKVVFKNVTPAMNFMAPKEDKPDPNKMARDSLRNIVTQSKGVEAWAELACKATEDGRAETSGVAYFADFNKLNLRPFDSNNVTWTAAGKSGTLELKMEKKGATSKPEPKAMTEQELAAAVKAAKAQYQQSRPMMGSILASMKVDITYVLPGTLGEVEGFTKTDKGGARVLMEGTKMLEIMDKFMADDKQLTAAVKAGRNILKDGPGEEVLMEGMFGKKLTALKATSSDMKPQFDYQAEMTKAKAGQAEMLQKLGIDLDAK